MADSAPVELLGPIRAGYESVLTDEALAFVAALSRRFAPRIRELLARREARQAELDAGVALDFRPETAAVRAGEWRVAAPPPALEDRRVELTGPVDRKMIINALNSGANCFMADFEDATAPSWDNLVQGQLNLKEAVAGTLRYDDPASGKHYVLQEAPAVLFVRPRGLHLWEAHARVDGEPVPGSLFDFGLYLFHNARGLMAAGRGPYFYLPKLEAHEEARLWNEVFVFAQEALGLPRGTVRATVLIETLPAAFEMDEILHELCDHSAGLNCGRWDYIFSYAKRLRADANRVLPDRQQVTMTQPFMRAYTQLVVKTCHRRGAHAMGGMAAQIPRRDDAGANREALEKVRADKLREVRDGHDGTWVAHPGLIATAREVFDREMPQPNQLQRQRDDVSVTAADLLRPPEGTRTLAGLRNNIRVGILYLSGWLEGRAAVPIDHLMEDAATAEIARTQIWSWLTYGCTLDDGRALTPSRFGALVGEGFGLLVAAEPQREGRLREARELFEALCLARTCPEFLTTAAYPRLLTAEARAALRPGELGP